MDNNKLELLKHLHKTLICAATELYNVNDSFYEEPWNSPITDYADRDIIQVYINEALEKINNVTEILTKYTL